jgi:hypothetical protein
MSETNQPRRRGRGSIFFALLLVILGVIFLLSNTGVIQGDAWSIIWQFWPLLLIVIGLDSIYKREGLVAPTFMIGIGVIFLLANLGYLSVNVWQMVLTLWPILLIAIGFDILVGRRSIWAAIAGVILILIILAGSLWLFGVSAQGNLVQGEAIQQSLEGATRAEVKIEPGAGDIQIAATDLAGVLIEGSVPSGSNQRIESSYTVSDGVGNYLLRDSGSTSYFPGANPGRLAWNLNLTDAIPLELTLNLGAGNLDADLGRLDLDSLVVNTAVGSTSVTLPAQDELVVDIEGAIGQIVVTVPEGVGVRVSADTALVSVQMPPGFVRQEDVYQSQDYQSASQQVDVTVNLAIGSLVVRHGP